MDRRSLPREANSRPSGWVLQKLDGGSGPGRGVVHAVDCEEAPSGAPWLIHARSRITTAPAPPSAPLTATANFRSSTSSTTAPTPVSALQANTPSPASSPGDSMVGLLGRIVGPWICGPLPPPPIHPHSRSCRAPGHCGEGEHRRGQRRLRPGAGHAERRQDLIQQRRKRRAERETHE